MIEKHGFGPLLDVEMSKQWNAVMAQGTCQAHGLETDGFGTLLGSEMMEKWMALWRETLFQVQF